MTELTFWEHLLPLTSKLYGDVADLGCNVGTYSKRLYEIPTIKHVHGVDVDPQYMKQYVETLGESYAVCSIEQMGIIRNKLFDCAICWETLEHTLDPERALSEIHRTVRDLVLFTIPTPQYGLPKDEFLPLPQRHHHLWSSDAFQYLLQRNDFTWLSTYGFLNNIATLWRVMEVPSV